MTQKSSVILTLDAPVPMWTADVSDWRMKQIKEWTKAAQVGDVDEMNQFIITSVKRADGEFVTAEYLDDLTFAEWRDVVEVLSKAVNEIFRSAVKS